MISTGTRTTKKLRQFTVEEQKRQSKAATALTGKQILTSSRRNQKSWDLEIQTVYSVTWLQEPEQGSIACLFICTTG